MRSRLGGHFAGNGMESALVDFEDTYRNHSVAVRLPSDYLKADKLAELSGPVITYNLNGGQPNAREN